MIPAFVAIKLWPWGKILKIGLPILAVGLLLWYVFSFGSDHGKSVIQEKWNAEKLIDAKVLADTKKKIASEEAIHRANDRKISDELVSIKQTATGNIARIRTDFALRLQNNSERANLYRRQADAGAIERANLAGYAARLDQSLSEGIELVEELQATVELRDGQIRGLAAQINNDRQLITGSGQSDANSTTQYRQSQ
jgi:hypothetical protein